MSYLLVEDFRFGMDRRRPRVAGTPGTLWLGENVHLTRGGDIERRKKFVSAYDVTGTFGLAAVRQQPYVFGSADLASSMPAGVQYQRLQAPNAPAMTSILDAKAFLGALYVIAEYDDGNVYHFYNGTRVSDWDTIADAAGDYSTLARGLARKMEADENVLVTAYGDSITFVAKTPGVAFTIAKATSNGDATDDQDITLTQVTANVAEVSETLATADITITGGTSAPGSNAISQVVIDDVDLLAGPVDWSGSNASTAVLLAAAINNRTSVHNYTAEVSGTTVTISAFPGSGATPNGYATYVYTNGDVTVTADTEMTGGVTAVTAVAQVYTAQFIGTVEAQDVFTITLNGVDYKMSVRASATGRTAYVTQQRVWSPVGSLWRYCKLNAANVWDPEATGSDAGFINIAAETEGNEDLVGGGRYQNLTGVFSEGTVTLYRIDVDPANNAYSNSLDNTGTRAAKSITRYGNDDTFYLDRTGIRSLRARDSSNAPFVSDVGNAIDTFVQDHVATLPSETVRSAVGAIEPRDGRYWLALGERIYVLSFFPGAKISAWTYYSPTEFGGALVQAFARINSTIFVRAGDAIYAYGGLDGSVEPDDDEVVATVKLPFLSGKTQATIKDLKGFDLAPVNDWSCSLAFDPNDDSRRINIGKLSKITFADAKQIRVTGRTSLMAPELTCSKGGAASVSMLAIHYDGEDDSG